MSEQEQKMLLILIGVFGLLLVLMGIALVSSLRRRKSFPPAQPSDLEPTANPEFASRDSVSSGPPASSSVAASPEQRVSLSQALEKTQKNFFGRLESFFVSRESVAGHLDEIEEVLYTSDLGPQTVTRVMEDLSKLSKKRSDES